MKRCVSRLRDCIGQLDKASDRALFAGILVDLNRFAEAIPTPEQSEYLLRVLGTTLEDVILQLEKNKLFEKLFDLCGLTSPGSEKCDGCSTKIECDEARDEMETKANERVKMLEGLRDRFSALRIAQDIEDMIAK